MNPITIPNISIPTIGIPTIGIPSVGFPSASGGGGLSWPAGMKEHIKAWYDTKKQGMTNYRCDRELCRRTLLQVNG